MMFASINGYILLIVVGQCCCLEMLLTEPAEMTSVLEGETARLNCTTLPGLAVHWELKSIPLDISYRRYMDGTDLVVARVLHDQDRGPFTCVVTNTTTGQSITSRQAFLDITWLSETVKVKVHGKIPTTFGGNLTLSCHVEGKEPVQIQWFKNGDGLKTFGKVNTTGRDMVVTGVNPLDNGVYRCVASNEAGTHTSYNKVILTVPGEQWAQIVVMPEDLIAVSGTNAKFDCVYQFADVIEWYFKQTGPLDNSTHYTILSNGSLVVRNVTSADEGLYSCVGIRGESTEIPQIFSASLKIAYLNDPDNTTLIPMSDTHLRYVAMGGDLEIGCIPPAGLPKPTATWTRGGSRGPVLHLKGVTKSAEGNYTCIIENLAGTKTLSFQVVVTNPPEITQSPISLYADEGGFALFRCEYSGSHKHSSVRWYKDGLPVKGPRFNEKKGYLNITSVSPSDQGDYICQVITKPHPAVYSNPASLTVKEKLKFAPRPLNTNLEMDTVRKVHCRAQGAVVPVVKWIKEGTEDGALPSHVQDIDGTLHFNKVKVEDKGKYTCIASSAQGVINTTIDVDVVVSPRFTVLPQNPTDVYEGNPVVMDCVAQGDPTPAIHWDKNSNMDSFDKNRFQVLENGSLLIREVQITDEGKYGCTAGNVGGLKRYEVSLIVRGSEGYRVGDGSETTGTNPGGSFLSKTVAITLGAAGAYMVLVIGLMAYCRCRSKRNKQQLANEQQDPVLQVEAGHSGSDRKIVCNGDAGGHQSDGDITAHSHASSTSSTTRNYGRLTVTRDQLTDMMVLGRGQFGEVCLARVITTNGEPNADGTPTATGDMVVMVKALQETRDETVLTDFKRELDLFGRLDHPNVVKLLGLCTKQHPHYMILQYTDWGDLKQMLLATKNNRKDKPKPPEMTAKTIISLIRWVCLGMEHLSNHRLVHRDLAARNCLVTSDLSVKISLSALSCDVYRNEYFLHRNKLLPIRWMPPEVVAEDDFSTKSDVFSFGVTAWEICSGGDLPHGGRSDQEVLSCLDENGGLQLICPQDSDVPESVVQLITECTSPRPADRPAFSNLALRLSDMLSSLH
ncbi:inactive tyrosine-protein kinase 7-like isoform X2 [Rhodnius prolixus]|uniref:inactive tyrosine-protein kinase 7-like isoform X2 n=1 Tax=Rhodnius prolixus TaxID=13249 RepID=UPI003D1884AE